MKTVKELIRLSGFNFVKDAAGIDDAQLKEWEEGQKISETELAMLNRAVFRQIDFIKTALTSSTCLVVKNGEEIIGNSVCYNGSMYIFKKLCSLYKLPDEGEGSITITAGKDAVCCRMKEARRELAFTDFWGDNLYEHDLVLISGKVYEIEGEPGDYWLCDFEDCLADRPPLYDGLIASTHGCSLGTAVRICSADLAKQIENREGEAAMKKWLENKTEEVTNTDNHNDYSLYSEM